LSKEFIWRHYVIVPVKAKPALFPVIQILYVHGIEPEVGKCLHVIEDDPVDNKNGKGKNETACGPTGKIKGVEDANEYQLITPEAY